MKNKISTILSFIAVVFCLVVLAFGSGCVENKDTRMRKYLRKNHQIELAEEDSILFEANDIGWMGDGTRYFVLQFDKEPTDLLNKKGFYTNHFATGTEEERDKIANNMKKRFEKIISFAVADADSLEKSYKPDWGSEFLIAGQGIDLNYSHLEGSNYYYNIQSKILILSAFYL